MIERLEWRNVWHGGVRFLVAMMMAVALPLGACSSDDETPPTGDESSPTDGATSTGPAVDLNDLLVDCLLRQGFDVRRGGEADGEMNAGVADDHIDQTTPEATAAMAECDALTAAVAHEEADVPPQDAAREAFDTYMAAMTSCLLDHGFHLTLLGHPHAEVNTAGALLQFGPREREHPDFPAALNQCIDTADATD